MSPYLSRRLRRSPNRFEYETPPVRGPRSLVMVLTYRRHTYESVSNRRGTAHATAVYKEHMNTLLMPKRRRAASFAMLLLVGAAVVVLAMTACSDSTDGASKTATTAPVATPLPTFPGAGERATLRGALTLDGAQLNADFLGVRVLHDGLAAACQNEIPYVIEGRYDIDVAADAEVRGCGSPGAELLLWTFVNDTFVFSNETAPWPGSGAAVTFDASFSSTTPDGASKPVTEFKGHLFDTDGSELPGGTVVEAYVGDVLCGVTSLRYGESVERLYTLIVAGPESIPACAEGATLTFRLDGAPAAETAVNDLARGSEGHELDLTVQ